MAEGFSHAYASVPLTRVLGVTAEILLLDWSVLAYTCEEIKDIVEIKEFSYLTEY